MPLKSALSFFASMRQKFFDRNINYEIFERLFFHHKGEKDCGYPFRTRDQMIAQTEILALCKLLETVEAQIRNMPEAYGECFRYIMHRDLSARLRSYETVARQRVRRKCDPRLVATKA